jgi:putative MFS transporter
MGETMTIGEAEQGAGGRAGELAARLDRLPPTRTVWTIIVLLSIAYFFELYEMLLTGFIAPGLTASGLFSATTRGLFGTSGIAAFIAALFAGLTVGTLLTGSLADRFGRRAIFTWALLLYIAMSALMAFQPTAAGINLFRFLAGIGLGIESVVIDSYIAELVPRHARGRAFACSQAFGFTAVPLGAFLAWLLVPHAPLGLDGWRWVVLIGAVMALGGWYIRLRLPESPRWLIERGRIAEAEAIVAGLEARVAVEYGRPLPEPEPCGLAPRQGRFSEMWRPPYRRRTCMMIVFNIFQTVGYYGFLNWVPTLLIAQGITVTKSLAYTVLIALTAPLGPVIGFAVGDRIERKWVIIGSMAMLASVGLLFSATTIPAVLIACGMLLTTFQNIMSYSYHAYQAELFPTRIRAKAVGFVYSFSRMSQIANAFVIAFVLGRFGTAGVFMMIALAYLIVIVVTGIFGPRTSGRALEEISG